jgi:hypothetical protein
LPDEIRMFFLGMVLPVESIAVRSAERASSPRQPTSPVDTMSTLSFGSAFCRRLNENWLAFTPT